MTLVSEPRTKIFLYSLMSSGLSLSINLYQNRKLTSRPVLRTALHDKATFCEHFQKIEEDFTESFVYMYPSMHIFKPPLLLFIISIV